MTHAAHLFLVPAALTAEAVLWGGGALTWEPQVCRRILEPGCLWVIPALGGGSGWEESGSRHERAVCDSRVSLPLEQSPFLEEEVSAIILHRIPWDLLTPQLGPALRGLPKFHLGARGIEELLAIKES